jgi:uncharacterized protein
MDIYLPIAELSQNVFVLLAAGGFVGFLAGAFGVGGGFLLTPLLLFLGIPAPVAVASGANQVVGASVSGVIGHWKRGNVDVKMGLVLVAGGFVGSSLGVMVFRWLRDIGYIDVTIGIAYVLLLGVVGIFMLFESIKILIAKRRGRSPHHARPASKRGSWIDKLPLKMRFRKSRLYISVILPVAVGFVVGVLSAIMGVGGGFIMVPAMIYLLGMPTQVVVGTSLFQVIFVTANVTFLQAVQNRTVDVVLAMLLLIGGVAGAQFGVRIGSRLPAERLRLFLALMVLAVGAKVLYDLASVPEDLYSVAEIRSL